MTVVKVNIEMFMQGNLAYSTVDVHKRCGLNLARESGDFEQWITFFLRGVVATADDAVETAKNIMELQTAHRNLLWQKKISSPEDN